MKSSTKSQSRFASVPRAQIQRSQFDRSHNYKTTFDAGYLVPVFVDEALPGDTFNLSLTAFARLATPIKPVMDNMFLETFFFAVPNRLLWDNWQKFNGEQRDPGDSTDYLIPVIVADPMGGFLSGSVSDYFGMPVAVPGIEVSSFWHRAYKLIWNEWFRDQNLQNTITVPTDDGPDPDDTAGFGLLRRGKRHDYFTSCLPWPQKGPAVEIPVGGLAPLTGDKFVSFPTGIQSETIHTPNASAPAIWIADPTFGPGAMISDAPPGTVQGVVTQTPADAEINLPQIWADLGSATGVTINALRESFQIQRLYERDARGGTRYTEIVKSHFGVTSPDSRLQRPEYLGGGSSPVNLTSVPQTSISVPGDTPQANLAAYGTVSANSHSFTKSFTEHCVIIGMVCVRADLTYQQGLNRMFSRQTRWDYYWPALAHIGEQEVYNKEIYADGGISDDLIFGYQERYAEYRYKPSTITGQFRSSYPQSLDLWHLSQDYANLPVLNSQFIEENPPIDRVIAVPSEPHFLFDSYIRLKCARPMPTYGVPGLIDHF